jgi:hypothetical protein
MSEIRANAVPLSPATWPWWLDRIVAASTRVMILVFLGVLTFAAVRETAKKCSREPIYRTTSDGPIRVTSEGAARLVNGKHLECRTAWGDIGVNIP